MIHSVEELQISWEETKMSVATSLDHGPKQMLLGKLLKKLVILLMLYYPKFNRFLKISRIFQEIVQSGRYLEELSAEELGSVG